MKHLSTIFVCAALLSCHEVQSPETSPNPADSVVKVRMDIEGAFVGRWRYGGTGFAISEDRILTAGHVLEAAYGALWHKTTIIDNDGLECDVAYEAVDKERDVGYLRVDTKLCRQFEPIKPGVSWVIPGDHACFWEYREDEPRRHCGYVVYRMYGRIYLGGVESMGGYSGSPVLNEHGHYIGVLVARSVDGYVIVEEIGDWHEI